MTSTGESPAIIEWINMPGIDEQAVNLRGGDYLFQIEMCNNDAASITKNWESDYALSQSTNSKYTA